MKSMIEKLQFWQQPEYHNYHVGAAVATLKEAESYIKGITMTKQPDGWSSDYYKIPQGTTELGDLIEHRNMNFNVGNIFKAAYRLGSKPGVSDLYDLKKILWFVKREIARIENVEDNKVS